MACHYKPYHLHYEKKEIKETNVSSNRTGSALIIVNVQKAFLPGGSMGILNGRLDSKAQSLMMIENINSLIEYGKFDYHIYVQDAHPNNHTSFASSRDGAKPFQVVDFEHNGKKFQQILWPDHCRIDGRDYAPRSIIGAADHMCKSGSGIQFATELIVPEIFHKNGDAMKTKLDRKSFVVNTGESKDVDTYSAFKNYLVEETGLASALITKGIKYLYVVGLTRDFAAWWTAVDATTYVDSNQNPIFDVKFVWDAALPAPGSDKLLEYEYDGDVDSAHHNQLKHAIKSGEYGIREVMRGLINPDPTGNRWVQTYLTPYNIEVIKTSNLLNIPVDATLGSMANIGMSANNNDMDITVNRIEKLDTSKNQNLDFLRIQNSIGDSTVLPDTETIRSDNESK